MKDVNVSAAASGLPAGEIETNVALIHALIPLRRHAVGEELEAEVVANASARYRRTGAVPAWSVGAASRTVAHEAW